MAWLVLAALVAVVGAYLLGRRKRPKLVASQVDGRYEILAAGFAWAGSDSREASKVIEQLRAEKRAWRLLVDGVEKKRG